MDILSFGHGTLSAPEIVDLLYGAGVQILVDVRSFPGSRRNPHLGRESMQEWIPQAGIVYHWIQDLGGFRPKSAECVHDIAWRNDSFRNYAGYTRSPGFTSGITELLALARDQRVAYMCSEAVWWKCHRRIISDFLVTSLGVHVQHLMHDGSIREHRVTDGIRLRDDGFVVYDMLGQPALPGI